MACVLLLPCPFCSYVDAQSSLGQCPEDFSGWGGDSRQPGDEQWTYEKFSPYFRRFEGFNPNENFPVDETSRGQDGPVKVRPKTVRLRRV